MGQVVRFELLRTDSIFVGDWVVEAWGRQKQENCKVDILKNRLKKSAKIRITTESRRTRSSFINGSFLRALRGSVVQFFGIILAGCDFAVCLAGRLIAMSMSILVLT
jgi:hypothetical protein